MIPKYVTSTNHRSEIRKCAKTLFPSQALSEVSHNATTQVRVVKNTTKPPPQGVMTHLVQWPADIDGAVLNDIINNLRQRGGKIWVRKLKKKNTKIF